MVLGPMYMLSIYRWVTFGEFDSAKNGDLQDLNLTELVVFLPLLILVFLIGLHPQPILDGVATTSNVILRQVTVAKAEMRLRSDHQAVAISRREP